MEKIIIFSHENDIDGIGAIVLGKVAFGEIDYVLAQNVYALETKFREKLDDESLYQYDRVFITDLALYNPSLKIISEDPILSKKVLVFDHHKSAINEGCNEYDFTTIVEADESGKKRSGTDLFYEYLCKNGFLSRTKALDEFVELTRLEDTWEWKTNGDLGLKAHDMAILFNVIGIDGYVDSMLKKVLNSSVEFTEEEQETIALEKERYLKKLQEIWSSAECFTDEYKNRFAAVFAEYELRNELIEYVRGLSGIDIAYLIIVALEMGNYGQKSYRSVPLEFDVGKIAKAHGGGGHPAAAAVNITKEQREKTIELRRTNPREALEYLANCSYEQ